MILRQIVVSVEQELVGSKPQVTIKHAGIELPIAVLALLNEATRQVLVSLQPAVQVPELKKQ